MIEDTAELMSTSPRMVMSVYLVNTDEALVQLHNWYNIKVSKRYSGKSFKDSSVKKQPKLNLKEKRRIKKEKQKNQIS